jgi:hypothetical protein
MGVEAKLDMILAKLGALMGAGSMMEDEQLDEEEELEERVVVADRDGPDRRPSRNSVRLFARHSKHPSRRLDYVY